MILNDTTRIFFIVLTVCILSAFPVFAETVNPAPNTYIGVDWTLISIVLFVGLTFSGFIWFKVDSLKIFVRLACLLIPMALFLLLISLLANQAIQVEGGEQIELSSLLNIIVTAVLGMFFSVMTGAIIIRSIIHSLAVTTSQAATIAKGDLSQTFDVGSNDEIGQLRKSLNTVQEKMQSIISEVDIGAKEFSNAADQVAKSNTELSQRTQEQASSLEEISSSMEEMNSTVDQNADNAEQASDLSLEARIQADKGSVVVHGVVSAMKEIDASSEKIADITGVIDEIAFQTNLLALNAAVEAARAGDQGRGFAVVAGEVRKLAGRSAMAAKEIKALIVESLEKVKDGTKLASESGGVLNDIVMAVKNVGDRISEISIASKEQAQGINQVNQALLQMDTMTQGSSALVEETLAMSESLGDRATHLIDLAASYNTGDKNNEEEVINVMPIKKDELKAESPQHKAALPQLKSSVGDDSEWKDF